MNRLTVITGVGILAPDGIGIKNFWSLLSSGRVATRGITFFDPASFHSQVAAEINFDPAMRGLDPQGIRRMDRAAQLAVVATREAIADSDEQIQLDSHRMGVTIGSAVDATMGLEEEYRLVSNDGRLEFVDHEYAMPHLYNYLVPSSFAAEVTWETSAEGPTAVVSTGCTSGLDSVGTPTS